MDLNPKQCSRRGRSMMIRLAGKANKDAAELIYWQKPNTDPTHIKPVYSVARKRKKLRHVARKLAKSLYPKDFEKRQFFVAEYMTKVNQQLEELGHGS